MKRIVSLFLAGIMLISCSVVYASAEGVPSISAQAYALYCVNSSQLLLSHNESETMGMASTTKLMTALLTLEAAASSDKVVTFSKEMTAEGSSMYLKTGDKLRLSDLAAGMMMASGNDAANAAALSISGSTEKFAELMNSRAKQIGMFNTNFVNSSGLSDDNHYSTAYDMALLMAYAMENEVFAVLTSKKCETVDFIAPEGQQITYQNHNRLLSLYEYCVGGKTGYTINDGRCLVTCAQKDGLRLVAVTLNDRNDWNDHIALYEYGFENFRAVTLGDDGKSYELNVMGSQQDKVTLSASVTKSIAVNNEDFHRVKTQVYFPEVVYAPVKKGDALGRIVCTLDGEVLLELPLTAESDADYKESFGLFRFFRNLFYKLFDS